jgi:leucyl-tRNA synthetase
VRVPAEATPPEMEKAALTDAKLQAAVAGKQVVKVIVVPGKMVNVVVS